MACTGRGGGGGGGLGGLRERCGLQARSTSFFFQEKMRGLGSRPVILAVNRRGVGRRMAEFSSAPDDVLLFNSSVDK